VTAVIRNSQIRVVNEPGHHREQDAGLRGKGIVNKMTSLADDRSFLPGRRGKSEHREATCRWKRRAAGFKAG